MLWLSALGGRDAFEGIGTSRAVATGRDQKGHKCSRRRSQRSGMPVLRDVQVYCAGRDRSRGMSVSGRHLVFSCSRRIHDGKSDQVCQEFWS
jgi:hypothetical protein